MVATARLSVGCLVTVALVVMTTAPSTAWRVPVVMRRNSASMNSMNEVDATRRAIEDRAKARQREVERVRSEHAQRVAELEVKAIEVARLQAENTQRESVLEEKRKELARLQPDKRVQRSGGKPVDPAAAAAAQSHLPALDSKQRDDAHSSGSDGMASVGVCPCRNGSMPTAWEGSGREMRLTATASAAPPTTDGRAGDSAECYVRAWSGPDVARCLHGRWMVFVGDSELRGMVIALITQLVGTDGNNPCVRANPHLFHFTFACKGINFVDITRA